MPDTLTSVLHPHDPVYQLNRRNMLDAPSNGLVHAANQVTAIDNAALGSTVLSSELGSVNYVASTYNRVTFPIAVFATGRGVSFKELAAVSAGGANYNPAQTELTNGMI